MRPTLIYDGDCGHLQVLGDVLAGADRRADRLSRLIRKPRRIIRESRSTLSAARSSSSSLTVTCTRARRRRSAFSATRRGRQLWWWVYAHVPGFATVAEWAYAFFARRRGLLNAVTRFLWGPVRSSPSGTIWRARCSCAGWASSISPRSPRSPRRFSGSWAAPACCRSSPSCGRCSELTGGRAPTVLVPTLFWFNASDTALVAGTIAGMALALLVTFGLTARCALVGLFALYLSYVYAGQSFMMFQWDLLLLEAGFLAIFLAGGSRIVVWLYRWLVFRFLFMAGAAKLLSGDPTWRSLTALEYHFETQPLPTPARVVRSAPAALDAGCGTAATLVVEVVRRRFSSSRRAACAPLRPGACCACRS